MTTTTRRLDKILVANRGEIACRVMRTCREMGIATVAVFSDADADAPHVAMADEAVRIGPPPAAESYLRIDRIVSAAARTGAAAIHPGYGFLAENAAFADACAAAGVVFIGPSAHAIRALGSKRAARQIARAAGVPVVPGYDGDAQDTAALVREARAIGFPVLIKASAGGGGKGMRIVRHPDSDPAGPLGDQIDAARREAQAAFGDGALLIERYIERPRHVEIQLLGDAHGSLVHLFERECSIQRRHQKIIEETPSPAVDDALRARMGEAAVAVGRAAGYHGAGTVELILDPDGSFYFLEVNTRLQVEHPITECVTGLDLVREQIRVAQGEPLGLAQADVAMSGAAIECRLYAEDPDHGFLPTTGRIADWHVPEGVAGLRVDAGVRAGQHVSIHYDPMLAKVICHGATRAEARARMAYSLERLSVHGVVTNRDYLLRVLRHEAFARGAIDTHFVERHVADLAPAALPASARDGAAIAATLAAHETRRAARSVLPSLEPGYRNNRSADEQVAYRLGDDAVTARYRNLGGGRFAVRVSAADGATDDPDEADETIVALVSRDGADLVFEDADGWRRTFRVIAEPGDAADPRRATPRYHVQGGGAAVCLVELPRFPEPGASGTSGGHAAPMPGKVVKVLVSVGQAVTAGDPLIVLEAMKMEHTVRADADGAVAEIAVAEGDQVDTDQLLAVIEPTRQDQQSSKSWPDSAG